MSQSIFKNPYVLSAPVITGSSVGNGTLTIDRLTHFTINQSYMAICSAISPFTVFNIVGALDGVVGVAIVGTQFTDEDLKVFLTIQQGPTLFAIGDTFEFEVAQGTDVNQQNIDLFDELPQKNFGVGQVGELKGNNNIRFSIDPVKAFRAIQDLLYRAKNAGPEDNAISIEYIEGSLLAPASLTLQSLTFIANTSGESGNDISIEYEEFTPGVAASASIQDIDYQAANMGVAGNAISIEYTGGATAGFEVVTIVSSTKIKVQIQNGVSTGDDIEVAIAMHVAASTLVSTTGTGATGAEPQFIQAETFLTGGVDQIGDSVEVVGNAIKVKFEGGVATATDVKALVDASPAALTLVTTVISGGAGTVQLTPVAPTFLSGGTEVVGTPGAELVEVTGKEIKIHFIDGLSTAQQLKTALEANVQAAALIDIILLGTGTEFQASPNPKLFLAGGSDGGTFSFNSSEFTDAENFFEGNAPILHKGQTNQGDELTLGVTTKKGKVILDDDDLANDSGLVVANAQKTINNLIQNEKILLSTATKITWIKPNLSFISNIELVFADTAFKNSVLTSASPITIADGEHAYVVLDRSGNANVTVVIATTLPKNENILRLFSRIGDNLIWYDNTFQADGKSLIIGEGSSVLFKQEIPAGTVNGVNVAFTISQLPDANDNVFLTLNSRELLQPTDYSIAGLTLTLVVPPAFGQQLNVSYIRKN